MLVFPNQFDVGHFPAHLGSRLTLDGGRVSASSEAQVGSAARAVDGTAVTAWEPTANSACVVDGGATCCYGEWLDYVLPAPTPLGGVALRSLRDGTGRRLNDGFVLALDDAGTVLRSLPYQTDPTFSDWAGVLPPGLPPVARLRVLPGRSAPAPHVAELELYGPRNDGCRTAFTLSLDGSGVGSVRGDTRGARSDLTLCSVGGGADVVYAVSVPRQGDLQLEVSAEPGSSTRPLVGFASAAACAAPTACARQEVGLAALLVHDLAPGDYVVWVDAEAGGEGPFRLRAKLFDAPVSAPSNDACMSATNLVNGAVVQAVAGSTAAASSLDSVPECDGGWGASADVYFKATGGSGPVVWTVAAQPGERAPFALSTLASCSGPQQSCVVVGGGDVVSFQSSNVSDVMRVRSAADAGLHFLVSGQQGTPANNTCGAASFIEVRTPTSDEQHLSSLSRATDNFNGAGCSAGASSAARGKDVFFYFLPPATGTYVARVRPEAGLDVSLFAVDVGCAGSSCTWVNDGGVGAPEALTFTAQAGVPLVLVVDSAAGAEGFVLTVE